MKTSLLLFLGLQIPAALAAVAITDGEDWSLPDWARPLPYSGFYTMDSRADDPLVRHIGTTLTWRDINPAEGVYDFSLIERYLALAKQRGGMCLFRLKASIVDAKEQGVVGGQREMVPQWVLEKYHPKTFHTKADKLYAAPWNSGMQAEFHRLVREIGRRGFLESPQFLAIYLHGVSTSYGEEMNIDDPRFTAEAKAAGLSADTLMKCWKDRMDWWAEAAGRNIGKVIWVGAGVLKGLDYPRAELDAHAKAKGLGLRAGFIEHYYYARLHPPLAGQSYENGYIVSNWSDPMHDGRYFGDEDETNEFEAATGEARAIVARSPYFRAAQVGLNFLWVSRETLEWVGGDEGIARWYSLVAGKGPLQSPDAACWLREARIRLLTGPEAAPWKNMERMLLQRDVEGARTVPAGLVKMPYVQLMVRGKSEEYTARRTDVANGQTRIAFRLDPDFKASLAGPVTIRVHFHDNARSIWRVVVSGADGRAIDLGSVTGRGDGAWRTASFDCDRMMVPGVWSDPSDFSVEAESGGDVTVRYVRVVRTQPPLATQ